MKVMSWVWLYKCAVEEAKEHFIEVQSKSDDSRASALSSVIFEVMKDGATGQGIKK